MEEKLIKICSVCGSENAVSNELCEGCGALLKDAESKKSVIEDTEKIETPKKEKVEEKKPVSKKINKKDTSEVKTEKGKELKGTNFYYLAAILIILGAVIVFTSGIFDEPQPAFNPGSGSTNMPDDHNHSGVDLSAVQRINDMEQALKANPNDHQTLLKLAHLLNDSGFYERAIVKYKEYLSTHPNEPDVLVDMGVCYFSMQDYQNAESYMKQALEINPKHQIGTFNLGIVAINQNKTTDAINYWNKAIEINPASDIANKAKDLINQYQ